MQHLISTQSISLADKNSYNAGSSFTATLVNKFITWCHVQEKNRFFWLGIALMGGIGTVLPLTLCAVVFIGGNDIIFWVMACVVNVPILVLNLAALPTKITLPVLFIAWAIDILIIAYCVLHFFVH